MLLVGFLCSEIVYRRKLSQYLMEKGGEYFRTISFSSMDSVRSYTAETRLDLLILDESDYKELCMIGEELKAADYYLVLTEKPALELSSQGYPDQRYSDQTHLEQGYPEKNHLKREYAMEDHPAAYICRYSTSGRILESIKKLLCLNPSKGCQVIGIASEIHRCGKTSLAVQLCRQLQENSLALLIVMDYRNPVFTGSGQGICNLVYELCKQSEEGCFQFIDRDWVSEERFTQILQDNVDKFDGIEYLPSSVLKKEMESIQDHTMVTLIEYLRNCGRYQYIVIDFPDQLVGGDAFKNCDYCYCPIHTDGLSDAYSERMRSEWMGKTRLHFLELPEVRNSFSPDRYYKELPWTSLGACVKELTADMERLT